MEYSCYIDVRTSRVIAVCPCNIITSEIYNSIMQSNDKLPIAHLITTQDIARKLMEQSQYAYSQNDKPLIKI
jgi:hypothetical protein